MLEGECCCNCMHDGSHFHAASDYEILFLINLQLSSTYANHCELDFEFLGNVSGEPYALQTNVFAEGVGDREQRITLWFDPSIEFHTYGILWNKDLIL